MTVVSSNTPAPAPTVADFLVNNDEQQPVRQDIAEDAGQGDEQPLTDEELAALEAGDDIVEGDPGEGEDGQEEPEAPPPPASWSKEDAEAWKGLTPEAREVVMRREKDIERFVSTKGREVAETKRQMQQELLQTSAQQADAYSAHIQQIAQSMGVQPPSPELLYTGNPDDVILYQRQDAAHRASLAQQQELLQRAAQAKGQADQARQQAFAEQSAAEAQRLRESLPEFFDPVEGPKIQRSLESVGQELGYTPELMAQASAADILALKTAADWKEKAAKYDKITAKRMETVRAAKTMPKVTRPGAGASQQATQIASEDRTAAHLQQFQRDRSAESAAALLFVRKR